MNGYRTPIIKVSLEQEIEKRKVKKNVKYKIKKKIWTKWRLPPQSVPFKVFANNVSIFERSQIVVRISVTFNYDIEYTEKIKSNK